MIEAFQEILTTDPVHADVMNTKIVAPGNKLVEFVKRPYSGDVIGLLRRSCGAPDWWKMRPTQIR